MKMKIAYLRVSSDEQRERQTIETQRAEVQKFCDKESVKLDKTYEDDGVSGTIPLARREPGQRGRQDVFSIPLRDDAPYLHHHASGGSLGEGLCDRADGHSEPLKPVEQVEKLAQVPAQPVELQDIDFPDESGFCVPHQRASAGLSARERNGAANAVVLVGLVELDAFLVAELPDLGALRLDGLPFALLVRADAQVCDFHFHGRAPSTGFGCLSRRELTARRPCSERSAAVMVFIRFRRLNSASATAAGFFFGFVISGLRLWPRP